SFNTLSLVTNRGSVSQTAGSTLTGSNPNLALAVRSSSGITLDQDNQVRNAVALRSNFGNVTFKQGGTVAPALNIGAVDGLSGVQASFGTVSISADKLNLNI